MINNFNDLKKIIKKMEVPQEEIDFKDKLQKLQAEMYYKILHNDFKGASEISDEIDKLELEHYGIKGE